MKVTVFDPKGPARPLREFKPGDVVAIHRTGCPRLVTGNRVVTGSVYLPEDREDLDCEFIPIEDTEDSTLFIKIGNIVVDVTREECE